IAQFIPPEMNEFLDTTLSTLAAQASPSLGLGAIGGLLITLWSASKGTKALMEGLNIIYDEKEDRGIFKYSGIAMGLTLLAIVLSVVALLVIVGIPTVTNLLNLPASLSAGIATLSWLVLLVFFS